MKITAIDVFQHDLPVKDAPYRMGLQDVWHLDSTIVRLGCDDGTVAYGETCPLGSTYQSQHAAGARAALTRWSACLAAAREPEGLAAHDRSLGRSLARLRGDLGVARAREFGEGPHVSYAAAFALALSFGLGLRGERGQPVFRASLFLGRQ